MTGLDLPAYLSRVGLAAPPACDLPGLRTVHAAHALRVPFENLDIQLGRPVRLGLAEIQEKLVVRRRGGYCFEQNALLLAVLRELGFRVTPLLGRVRYMTRVILPRTHMILRVDLPEGPYLADVGFGGHGPIEPLPLILDQEIVSPGERYRFGRQGELHTLQVWVNESWQDVYEFTLEAAYPVDYEMANHYTSTHPGSLFVQNLIVTLPFPGGRHVLMNRELSVRRGDQVQRRLLDDDALLAALREPFGLNLSPGTRFRCLLPT